MKPNGLIVSDGARCRFFRMTPTETEDFEPVVVLEELEDLVNPEARAPGHELFSNTKSGRNRAHAGGPAHGYDDHRQAHQRETLRRFARLIDERMHELVKQHGILGLVIVANAGTLGVLREQLSPGLRDRVIAEIEEDVTKESADELRHLLERRGVLGSAPRSRLSYRPRGQAG